MSQVFAHGRLRLYLLKLLDESPRHGYDVMRLLEDRFLGLYAPSAGTVYPRLARLEAEGLVTHDEDEGRKVYRLTDEGRAELHRREDDLAALEADIAGSVRDLAREVREDVHASVRDLRNELKAAAREVRREERLWARAKTGTDPTGKAKVARRPRAELEMLIEEFRQDARQAVRTADVDLGAAIVDGVHKVLDDTLALIRKVLDDRGHGD